MEQILLTTIEIDDLLDRFWQLIQKRNISEQLQQHEQNQSELITRKEVANLLKISLPTLHEWTKLHWLRSYKIGSRVLYKKAEVLESLIRVSSLKYKKGGKYVA